MQVKFIKSIVIPAIAGGIVFLSSCGDNNEKKISSSLLDKYMLATSSQSLEDKKLNMQSKTKKK